MFDREMCVCGFVMLCILVHTPTVCEIQRKGDKVRLLHRGRHDAKSTGCYKRVTTGRCRQSLLQETQIKADLSRGDFLHAVPGSSFRPVAILSLSVLRSVRRGAAAPEVRCSNNSVAFRGCLLCLRGAGRSVSVNSLNLGGVLCLKSQLVAKN